MAGPHNLRDRVAVHRAAFGTSTFPAEHWHALAAGSPYRRAGCLVGYDAHGTAISVAAAAALREMGASSATVCTPSSNVAAVAAYASAGYQQCPDVTDFRRPS